MKGISVDQLEDGARIADQFRRQTPALSRLVQGKTPVYMDAPGGTQMPQPVLQGMSNYVRHGMANRHGAFATSVETDDLLDRAREQVRALLNADGYVIVFGQNMTSLCFALAASLARDWAPGQRRDQVVVSEIDHHANIDPWRAVAADRGMGLRWLPVDTGRVSLDLDRLDEIVTSRCAVTAVGLASNAVGTIQDVTRIAQRTHEAGGIIVVDAVHAVPHMPVDAPALGADVLLCSAYKFFGPHIGVMAIRDELLERIRFYKVAPAPNTGPDKAEAGSQNHEAVAGLSAALEFMASLGRGETMRERLVDTISAVASSEDALAVKLSASLAAVPGVRLFRAPVGHAKTPTIAFTVKEAAPLAIARACAQEAVFVTNGDFYATTLAERFGLGESGGWVRLGLAPYIGEAEVSRAIAAVTQAAGEATKVAR
jgi:cysteine desulfurase family protein (TIGR01976 family)